jgi:hypothetical protein
MISSALNTIAAGFVAQVFPLSAKILVGRRVELSPPPRGFAGASGEPNKSYV